MVTIKSQKREYFSPRQSHSVAGVSGFQVYTINHNLGIIPDSVQLFFTISPSTEFQTWPTYSEFYSGNVYHTQGWFALAASTTQVTIRVYGWTNHFYTKIAYKAGRV